ncbi:MAG: hypothetical protein ACI82I_002407 [Gammaproteobacteria bacterium]|jgi:hypothetical protein
MSRKIVDLPIRERVQTRPPVSDFWFAQLDVRLGKIEAMLTRLEWQVWIIVCTVFGLSILEIINALSAV